MCFQSLLCHCFERERLSPWGDRFRFGLEPASPLVLQLKVKCGGMVKSVVLSPTGTNHSGRLSSDLRPCNAHALLFHRF